MYMAKSRDIRVQLSRLQPIISRKLSSTFAIIRLVVNFFWEIGIYICNSRNCSLLFLGNWHLHLRLSGLQSTFPGEFSSTFVILGLAVIFFRDIGIYICDSRNCSLLFPGNWHLHLQDSRLQSTIPGKLASTFALVGLAVNFFWEIGIYICDYRPCSQPFPGNWHLHLQDSRLQSIISRKLASTFVILAIAVNYFRDIGIYICNSRNCSQLFCIL